MTQADVDEFCFRLQKVFTEARTRRAGRQSRASAEELAATT